MLEGFRAISRTWFGKILGAFLIVGLAGFGISNVLLDLGSNKVAQVGNQEISVRAFQRQLTLMSSWFSPRSKPMFLRFCSNVL